MDLVCFCRPCLVCDFCEQVFVLSFSGIFQVCFVILDLNFYLLEPLRSCHPVCGVVHKMHGAVHSECVQIDWLAIIIMMFHSGTCLVSCHLRPYLWFHVAFICTIISGTDQLCACVWVILQCCCNVWNFLYVSEWFGWSWELFPWFFLWIFLGPQFFLKVFHFLHPAIPCFLAGAVFYL